MYQQGPPAPHIDEPHDLRAEPDDDADPAPLTVGQLRALIAAAARQLIWGLRFAARETHRWRARATQIPDAETRQDALDALGSKRGHIDGAALFWTIPRRRNPELLGLLAAYQIMWDFLDNVSERGAAAGQANGYQLHTALVDALDRRPSMHDYYRWHPWPDDGGYLPALVAASKRASSRMPHLAPVRELLLRDARRAGVQAINHDPDPASRAPSLHEWATREDPHEHEVSWFEFASAASAGLSIYALFAVSAEPAPTMNITRIYEAYFPWISAVTTMLDSYVDRAEDIATGEHSYVAYYPTGKLVVPRIAHLVRHGFHATGSLRDVERHRVIVASMVALHLSRDSARSTALRADGRKLARAGGSLTRLLVPILRLWRVAYSQQSA